MHPLFTPVFTGALWVGDGPPGHRLTVTGRIGGILQGKIFEIWPILEYSKV
jgi:hypothetical protein